MIHFSCPHCMTPLQALTKMGGQTARCGGCGQTVTIPASAAAAMAPTALYGEPPVAEVGRTEFDPAVPPLASAAPPVADVVPTVTPSPLPMGEGRCYDCGQLFPFAQLRRQRVQTSTFFGTTFSGQSGVAGQVEKVDLCPDCTDRRDRHQRLALRVFFWTALAVVGSVSLILLIRWIASLPF